MNATVYIDGIGMDERCAAQLIVSNIHRQCAVDIGNVKCPVWPTVVRDGSLHLVRWHDAAGSPRAMARV